MKRVLILSAAVLFCGVPLRAQVTKQVEVTKTYVPEVSKAVCVNCPANTATR